MQDLKVALIQDILHWEDPEANRALFSQRIAEAKENHLVLLPEMFTTGFTIQPENVAETMNGPSLQWMREQAGLYDTAISGSLIIEENGQYFNRLIFMHPEGRADFYDKRHLFRMGGEHERFGMGKQRIIINYRGWKILPLVCYDLRFPIWARNRYTAEGFEYDFLYYLANWPAQRNHPWKSLLTARAIENQCYVAGLNRCGTDGQDIYYSGASRLIDAKGSIITEASSESNEILQSVLRVSDLQEFRKKFRVGLDWDNFSLAGT